MDIADDKVQFSSSHTNQTQLPETTDSRERADSESAATSGWSTLGGNRWYYGKKYQTAIHMSLILNAILFILVIVLFALHHQTRDHQTPVNVTTQLSQKLEQSMSRPNDSDGGNFRIPILPTSSNFNISRNSSELVRFDPSNRLISFILRMAGWERVGNIYYKKFTDRVTYSEAQKRCRAIGGHLAAKVFRIPEVIRSMEAQGYSTNGRYPTNGRSRNSNNKVWSWIGFNDLEVESEWRWYDHEKTNWNLAQWSPGEPNNAGGNQDCGQIFQFSGGKMIIDDGSCDIANNYICEIEIIY